MIRKAMPYEYERVHAFYWQLIDDMQNAEYHPKWQKGIYPTDEDIREAIEQSEMYIYLDENDVVLSAMRVNHSVTEGYDQVEWSIEAEAEEITVIHMLGVGVATQGKGVAKEMVNFVIDMARRDGQKCIRLDVLEGNVPAFRLYESVGFKPAGSVQLFYEDTGLTDFVLYEYNF